MTPTIGRIVHYQSFGTPGGEFLPQPRAAVIVDLCPDVFPSGLGVTVCVLNPSGIFFNTVDYSEEPKPGHWNWPPRV